MNRTEFEALVKRLESAGAGGKQSYRVKVALLAAAGYAYILTVLLLVVGIALLIVGVTISRGGGYVAMKFLIPLGALAVAVLRSLWVRWPQPTGLQINASQAPELFSEIEAIRAKIRAPRIHRVLVNDAYNAAMEQRPRLGIFGWPEGILHIGLPLMNAMSPAEFRAVLAHEMGHLSGNHGRVTGWVYRLRETWGRLLQLLEAEGRWGSGLFTRFLQWYAPFLNAYSFVLARDQEYEADRCAAAVVGKDAAARMLVALRVRGSFLDENFWPGRWKLANDNENPPADIYAQQATAIGGDVRPEDTRRWIAQSLSVKTGYVDTHPSLSDRLAALGASVSASQWAGHVDHLERPSAAEAMLDGNAEVWSRQLSKAWLSAAAPSWKERYREVQVQRTRFAELHVRRDTGALTEEEEWELANLVNSLESDEAALPFYQRIVERNSEHVSANFTVGRLLLQQGDSKGLAHLAAAMTGDPECTPTACYLAEQFLREHGDTEEAERYHRKAIQFADYSDEAEKERQTITAQDSFMPHGFESAAVEEVREHLKRQPHLKAAYVVRKAVRIFPEKPAFVLGLVPKTKWYGASDGEAEALLLNNVVQHAPVPAGTYVILLNSSNKALRKKLEGIAGARILVK